MTLFIGPINDMGGPAIKNKNLIQGMNIKNLKLVNSYNQSIFNRLTVIFKLVFTREKQLVLATSSNGRKILFPIISLKKFVNKNLKYALILIGGNLKEEIQNSNLLYKNALQNADIVTVETKMLKNDLNNLGIFKNLDCYYMPNFIASKKLPTTKFPKNMNKVPKFVFLSTVKEEKGIIDAIEVFKNLPYVFDIFGPIPKSQNRDFLNHLSNNIHYKGAINNDNVVNVLEKYDVFIFPTKRENEGFPAVILEAYCSGLAVIASDAASNSEIIKHNYNGYLFEKGNRNQMKEVILTLSNDYKKIEDIKKNNLAEALLYSAEEVSLNFKKKLEESGWKI
ncbi:glycosyltransferase [Enterococcus sp. OL5]|uniref:glycosyltransferase n=1 Tax=Enterococcus sp. OL5 TaxID=2590214 RepID=UPI00112D232A|nr:glycosyltransferase [Enterococcus sp. OL5]TPR59621.1 glycosyltransferase family 4 protein [Enterococcus sp. OL5]